MRRRLLHDDRGSASVWLIALSVVLSLAIGGAVDGSRKAQAHSRAFAIAEEAARSGGQALRAQALAAGQDATVNPETAASEARNYLTATGSTGVVSVQGNRIVVDTAITEPTIFLSVIGIAEYTVHGHGTADLISAG